MSDRPANTVDTSQAAVERYAKAVENLAFPWTQSTEFQAGLAALLRALSAELTTSTKLLSTLLEAPELDECNLEYGSTAAAFEAAEKYLKERGL